MTCHWGLTFKLNQDLAFPTGLNKRDRDINQDAANHHLLYNSDLTVSVCVGLIE